MFTDEDRIAFKRLQKAWEKGEFLYYHNTVTWKITKAPYLKDDVVYIEVIDQHSNNLVIEKPSGSIVEFVKKLSFGGEYILFDFQSPNRGWYARIPTNWAVVWKTKDARSIALFNEFIDKTSFKANETIRLQWDMYNRIFVFHEDPYDAKQKLIMRNKRPCINISGLNAEKTFKGISYRLQLFRFYIAEEKVIQGEKVIVLTPQEKIGNLSMQDVPVRKRGMKGSKKSKKEEI